MWLGKDKVQKSLVKALNRYEKQEELKKKLFLFYRMTQKKILERSQSAVERE